MAQDGVTTPPEDATTGLLSWLTGRSKKVTPTVVGPNRDLDDGALLFFACTTCGRTDLPAAGDWDPPICSECDAAINFDAIEEQEWYEDEFGDG